MGKGDAVRCRYCPAEIPPKRRRKGYVSCGHCKGRPRKQGTARTVDPTAAEIAERAAAIRAEKLRAMEGQ